MQSVRTVDQPWIDLFEDRYGVGSFERLMTHLNTPCTSFARHRRAVRRHAGARPAMAPDAVAGCAAGPSAPALVRRAEPETQASGRPAVPLLLPPGTRAFSAAAVHSDSGPQRFQTKGGAAQRIPGRDQELAPAHDRPRPRCSDIRAARVRAAYGLRLLPAHGRRISLPAARSGPSRRAPPSSTRASRSTGGTGIRFWLLVPDAAASRQAS